MILGYARVLTSDQSLDGQRHALKEAGAGCLFTNFVRYCPALSRVLRPKVFLDPARSISRFKKLHGLSDMSWASARLLASRMPFCHHHRDCLKTCGSRLPWSSAC